MKTKLLLLNFMLMFAISSYGQSGKEGNISWNITDSVLTISATGNGKMDFFYSAPWTPYRSVVKHIIIRSSVTTIGRQAFSNFINIESVEIPSSVTSVEYGAFQFCSNLTSVIIQNGVINIGDKAFSYCENILDIIIPNSVTSIGDYAFEQCYSLKNIEIPNSVTSIGEYAFYACSSLTKFIIPSNISIIENGTFFGCRMLDSIEIHENITNIGEWAFNLCEGLKRIEIPSSITNIGESAFSGCSSLDSVKIPNSLKSIEGFLFSFCTSLKNIEIPNSVTTIGRSAFSYCSSLKNIEIPNSVTFIGLSAFQGCSMLDSIEIPITVTKLTEHIFSECISLKNFKISKNVTHILWSAFDGCTSLTSIDIPSNITNIDQWAFANCTNLKTVNVYWDGPLTISSTNVFSNYPEATLVVPAGTKDLYRVVKAENVWRHFGTIIERAPEVTVLVTSVSLLPGNTTLVAGSSLQLTATVAPSNATNKNVTWSSSNDAIATVDSQGKVTAHATGTATITVTTVDGSKTATCNVTVFEIAITSISLNTTSDSVFVGDVLPLIATINPSYASNKTVTWSSSNTEVATVDSAGNVSGISEGVAVITATASNGMTATCTITVYQKYNHVSVEIPLKYVGQSIIFEFDLPAGGNVKGSLALTLPEGLEIEISGITITESLSEGLVVTATPLGNNVWLFEVGVHQVGPLSMSLRSSTKNNPLTNITYRISGVQSEAYELRLKGGELSLSSGNVPNYELVLRSGETANMQVSPEVNAFIANGELTVTTPDSETIKLYNSTGTLVYTVKKTAGKTTYSVSGLANGIYVVTGNKWSVKVSKM